MVIAIVPAYNEEKTVGSVVRSLLLHVDRVVVVDDGSTDATGETAAVAGAIVLRHPLNRGQGASLETGHEYARLNNASHVVHFDGDDQFDVIDIPKALSALKMSGADILFGSRFLDSSPSPRRRGLGSLPATPASGLAWRAGGLSEGRKSIPWFKKNILHPVARLVNRGFGGVHLSDAHNGFRILTKDALEKIRITHDRMAHATEIPVQAKRHGLRYIEFPVQVVYREYGQRARGGVEIVKDLFLGKFIR